VLVFVANGCQSSASKPVRDVRFGSMPPKSDEIVEIVQSDIVSGRLPPGAVLRQEHLARSFRVSRTPVREALKRLHAAGLVSLIPHTGARVRTLSAEDLRESFVVRAELEGLAAELAATRITSEQRKRLREAERRFARATVALLHADDQGELRAAQSAANDEFHDVILEAAGVRLLADLARSVRRRVTGQISAGSDDGIDELLTTTIRQHRSIRELIGAGSSAAARAVMQEHIESSGAFMEAVLARPEPPSPRTGLLQRMNDPFYLRGSERQ
jgi:DNA-binding GntR family transcriptional regulator